MKTTEALPRGTICGPIGAAAAWLPLAVILALPLVGLARAGATGPAGAHRASAAGGAAVPSVMPALLSSAEIGAIAAAFAMFAGTSAAIVATRTGWRRHPRALLAIAAAPLLSPGYVSAYALTDAGGLTSSLPMPPPVLSGVVLGGALWPVVAILSAACLTESGGALEESVLSFARPISVLFHVTLRLAAPGAVAGASAVFLMAAADYGIPSLLQARSFAGDLLELFSTTFDAGAAVRAALPALPLLLLAVAASPMLERLQPAGAGAGRSQAPRLEGRSVALALAPGSALALASAILPVAMLLRRSGPLSSFLEPLRLAGPEIGRSAALAAASAGIACAAAIVPAYLAARRAAPLRGVALESFALFLFLVPGSLTALGVIGAINRPGLPGALYGTPLALGIALAARTVFVPLRALRAAVGALSRGAEEAAFSAERSLGPVLIRVVLPRVARSLSVSFAVAFAIAFAELPLVVLLAPPGFQTLAPRLFNLMHYGRDQTACALGLWLILGAGAVGAVAGRSAVREEVHT